MKKLAAIRKAETLQERLALAEDKKPGTAFDAIFKEAKTALELIQTRTNKTDIQSLVNATYPGPHTREQEVILGKVNDLADPAMTAARQSLECIGMYFARLFKDGKSLALDDLPKAFNIWRRHTPSPDVIRAEIIDLLLKFPPDKPRLERVGNEIVEREPWLRLSNREIQERLKLKGYQIVDPEPTARQIRRIANELQYPLDSTPPGRTPKQKSGQKPQSKA